MLTDSSGANIAGLILDMRHDLRLALLSSLKEDKDGDGDDAADGEDGDKEEEEGGDDANEKEGFESLAPEEPGEEEDEGQDLMEDDNQPQAWLHCIFAMDVIMLIIMGRG